MMDRATIFLLSFALLAGCKRKDENSSSSDEDFDPLPVTNGEFDAVGEIVQDTCGNDVGEEIDDLTLKFDQIETGLSIFFDPDIGWVPCEGSIRLFQCQWGNAPSDEPTETWSWHLTGSSDESSVDATLTVEISCGEDANNCDDCKIVEEIHGRLD